MRTWPNINVAAVALAAVCLAAGAAGAATNYVWSGGTHTEPYADWTTAATNIQTAVDYASANYPAYDTVLVTNGTYNITSQIGITNGIAVHSVNGPQATIVQQTGALNIRIFSLTHANAVLDGFTIRKGHGVDGSGVNMTAGTVTNCVIRDNGTPNGDFATMNGAGVYMTGGLLVRCTVVSNSFFGNTAGLGVWASGAGAMISHCTIAYNQYTRDTIAGGVYLAGGATLRSSLIRGNSIENDRSGGGVYMTGAGSLVESCTIVENTAGDGGGIYIAGGSVSNSIVRFNSAGANPNYRPGGNGLAYSCAMPLPAGPGNTDLDPLFTDRPAGNFLVLAGPARNRGSVLPWMSTSVDLNGNPRLDSNGLVDMGAYQRQGGALECSLSADAPRSGIAPLTVTFRSYVEGLNTNGLVYRWDFQNDGTFDLEGGDRAVATNTYMAPGVYSVRLAVTNDGSETATYTNAGLVTVTSSNLYVSTTGTSQSPYSNLTTAATNFLDAFAVAGDGTRILVDSGVYPVDRQIDLNQAVQVSGIYGAETTTVQRTGAAGFRVFSMTHAGAVIEGLTIRNGYGQEGAGVYMTGGTLRNCILRNNNAATYGYSGGGVYMTGGTVSNCIIRDSYSNIGMGSGVYMTGGLLYRCTIVSNELFSNQGGGGVWASGAGVVISHCVIAYNRQTRDGSSGGVSLGGGAQLRNSLVRANTSTGPVGGVYMAGAGSLVESCTVVDNSAAGDGGGIYIAGGSVSNSIVYFNSAGSNPNYHPGGNGFAYSCTTPLPAGPGNADLDPLFVDRPGGNFLVLAGPARDAGSVLPWMSASADLNGNPRLDSDGRVDMGAYQRQRANLECSLSANAPRFGIAPLSVTFNSSVGGLNTNGLSYRWDFENDGTFDVEGADQAAPSHAYPAPGLYSVLLAVSNAVGDMATYTNAGLVTVTLSNLYVSTTGSGQVPYSNLTTAATNFLDAFAVAAGGTRIFVDSGEYPLTQQIELDRPVQVYGIQGAVATTLKRIGAASFRIFNMTHAGAVIDGFTIRNGYGQEGAGVYMTGGTLRNCMLRDNNAAAYGYSGGGVYMTGGTVSNCIIRDSYSSIGMGSGVFMMGGLLYRCTVVSNELFSNQGGGGVLASGTVALVSHCIITYNRGTRDGYAGGVHLMAGARLRNCLVGWNTEAGWMGGGVRMDGAGSLVESCTIVSNTLTRAATDGGGVYIAGGAVSNSIVYFNNAPTNANYRLGGSGFAYSCTTPTNGLTGEGNIADDPQFIKAATGNCRLQRTSPCINNGTPLAWMTGALDLDGRTRVQSGGVDMGAYEVPASGTLFVAH